jgi:hypothetical protein
VYHNGVLSLFVNAAGDRLWGPYYEESRGVVFMVDATDPHRLEEARDILGVCGCPWCP